MQIRDVWCGLSCHEHLRSSLREAFPDTDEDTISDTLEGLTDLPQIIGAVLRSRLEDLSLARALRTRIDEMEIRMARFESRAEKKRQIVTSVMERADLRKIVEPEFTASLRRTPAGLLVLDENQIPEAFWRPQSPKLDRRALLAALKAGEEIRGAALDNGGTALAVRTT
jgi:hypothetical protein